MKKIEFYPNGYWDMATMNLGDAPTDEQSQVVQDVCDTLNNKYSHEIGCIFHPNQYQGISIAYTPTFIDVQVDKRNTCGCHDIVTRLLEIRDIEIFALNPNHKFQ